MGAVAVMLGEDVKPRVALPRIVVVAPTFNNGSTLGGLLEKLESCELAVIVVNDGSTDGSGEILSEWENGELVREERRRFVVGHQRNLGKAEALRSGFGLAGELGFSHVLTLDTDGQHDPADIPALLAAARRKPEALVVGVRDLNDPAYPRRSRWGRQASNVLVWLHSGLWVKDSQCGMRVYPLGVMGVLNARAGRYAFETEVLVYAGFAGVEVEEVEIRCIYRLPEPVVSHFMPWRDSLDAVRMHVRLAARSMWPRAFCRVDGVERESETGTFFERMVRWTSPKRTWQRLRFDMAERDRLSSSFGWGAFMALQPYFGVKTVMCLALAKVFRLQPLVVIAVSSLTSPPIGVAAWMLSIVVGHWLLHGTSADIHYYSFEHGAIAVLRRLALEWCVGGLALGIVAGVTVGLVGQSIARRLPLGKVEGAEGQCLEAGL